MAQTNVIGLIEIDQRWDGEELDSTLDTLVAPRSRIAAGSAAWLCRIRSRAGSLPEVVSADLPRLSGDLQNELEAFLRQIPRAS